MDSFSPTLFMSAFAAIAELICRMRNVEFWMLNVRNSSDALAQPVAADSDNSKFLIYHSTFPMPLHDEPS